MRASMIWLSLLVAGCGARNLDEKLADKPTVPALSLAASPLELEAKAAVEKHARVKLATDALEKKVKGAMEIVLIDPFSAQFRTLRSGRNGAVCGQVNGKNRMGAYVGFRDFVLGKDGKTVWMSQYSDGVESQLYTSFADAFVGACASKVQLARFKAATSYMDSGYDAAGAATEAEATAQEAAIKM